MYSSFFRFLHFICSLSVLLFSPENYTHTGDQNVTSPTSTHSTAQGNQLYIKEALGIIESLDAPNHGPLLSAAFTVAVLIVVMFLARA